MNPERHKYRKLKINTYHLRCGDRFINAETAYAEVVQIEIMNSYLKVQVLNKLKHEIYQNDRYFEKSDKITVYRKDLKYILQNL